MIDRVFPGRHLRNRTPFGKTWNLSADPREENELSQKNPDVVQAMRLRARQAVGPLEDSAEDPELPEIDEGVLERLRSLGYLSDSSTRPGAPAR